jgi:phosphate transport system protein
MAMAAHTRTIFDADRQDLMRMVAEMGGIAEQQITQTFDALAQRNIELAQQVIDRDAALDALQTRIEEKSINIIAQRQPLAIDLREIISALHISSDLERIGDLAKTSASEQLRLEIYSRSRSGPAAEGLMRALQPEDEQVPGPWRTN